MISCLVAVSISKLEATVFAAKVLSLASSIGCCMLQSFLCFAKLLHPPHLQSGYLLWKSSLVAWFCVQSYCCLPSLLFWKNSFNLFYQNSEFLFKAADGWLSCSGPGSFHRRCLCLVCFLCSFLVLPQVTVKSLLPVQDFPADRNFYFIALVPLVLVCITTDDFLFKSCRGFLELFIIASSYHQVHVKGFVLVFTFSCPSLMPAYLAADYFLACSGWLQLHLYTLPILLLHLGPDLLLLLWFPRETFH